MIYLYSPATAAADVAQAKELAAFRNGLFHGVSSDAEFRNHSIACKELLRRYLGLVASARRSVSRVELPTSGVERDLLVTPRRVAFVARVSAVRCESHRLPVHAPAT